MSVWVGLAILAGISVLLGKVIFEPENASVQAATRPVLRNFIWQMALPTSATLGLVSQLPDLDSAASGAFVMAYVGIIAFALVCLSRSMIQWRSVTTL